MKSKTKLLFLMFTMFSFILAFEMIYIQSTTILVNNQIENKKNISNFLHLPNLAISSDEIFLRHRSYANISDIFPNDGELQSNSKMSFVY